MFWQENNEKQNDFVIPDNVLDVIFPIKCKMLPLDHAHQLSKEVTRLLPWIDEEPQSGIHQIYGAESGNGWMRPEDPENEILVISRRQKFTLRIPKHRLDDVNALCGKTIKIDKHELTFGNEFKQRLLSDLPTLFARYVITEAGQSEDEFMQEAARVLNNMGIRVRKMMAGKERIIRTDTTVLTTRALMLADLEKEQSIQLQESGFGKGRKLGCGLFMPQKGISAVNAD